MQKEGEGMADVVQELLRGGFWRVEVLSGKECGWPEEDTSILLALWRYEAEAQVATNGAWIHPYYFASQKAYMAASSLVKSGAYPGLALHDEIRVKPIFARLPGFSQGKNTLSYADGAGSRFHVQILTITPALPPSMHLLAEDKPLHCGACTRCIDACPTNALEGGVFHRERCIRNWMMPGQPVPEEVRAHMGNRLIGCDVCQRVCPHNPKATGETNQTVSLESLLTAPKEMALSLRPEIGVNLTLPNRVLAQSCLIAGCSADAHFLPLVDKLSAHPSPAVAEHARWAAAAIRRKQQESP